MNCINCGKHFHYCSSCGYIPEAEWECCSSKCVHERINKLEGRELIEVLADHIYCDNVSYDLALQKIRENKREVGIELVGVKLEHWSACSDTVPLEEVLELECVEDEELINYLFKLFKEERLSPKFALAEILENEEALGIKLVDEFLEEYDNYYPTADKD
ncbi:hypothetical protein H6G33_09595 [Calothrix sp. FACHB-1219]|uniref:hypothetical protein n=1 Tax=unclassified Calothrix TaxID=2619626 RepID=UPI0016858A36|nr:MULTISPECIES: hypothetical protein [unclassified Calothrix]MBD2201600.1 hypothetical protein [Calothrix sp. FACHB-168]MBD2217286.1 hypothetical protein [Calothrix sp. FACHB-1219]